LIEAATGIAANPLCDYSSATQAVPLRHAMIRDREMMKNSLVASVEFYFKGERYAPSARIDLDRMMESSGGLPSLYSLIARENGIDLYSYEYEVMEMEPIHFSEVEGFVADFIHNGELDQQGFVDKWQEVKVQAELAAIVRRCMGIEEMAQQPGLEQALLEAYRLGQAFSKKQP
jgi:hypothetical protein